MIGEVVIETIMRDFIFWRCLHGGPLSRETIEQWAADTKMLWVHYRVRQ
jgi:hypothetical protein